MTHKEEEYSLEKKLAAYAQVYCIHSEKVRKRKYTEHATETAEIWLLPQCGKTDLSFHEMKTQSVKQTLFTWGWERGQKCWFFPLIHFFVAELQQLPLFILLIGLRYTLNSTCESKRYSKVETAWGKRL